MLTFAACELNVIRSTPISAINKEKKMRSEYFQPLEMYLQHIIHIRSHTFQVHLSALEFGFVLCFSPIEKMLIALRNSRAPLVVQRDGASYVEKD